MQVRKPDLMHVYMSMFSRLEQGVMFAIKIRTSFWFGFPSKTKTVVVSVRTTVFLLGLRVRGQKGCSDDEVRELFGADLGCDGGVVCAGPGRVF
jgi:hypothetical protein